MPTRLDGNTMAGNTVSEEHTPVAFCILALTNNDNSRIIGPLRSGKYGYSFSPWLRLTAVNLPDAGPAIATK